MAGTVKDGKLRAAPASCCADLAGMEREGYTFCPETAPEGAMLELLAFISYLLTLYVYVLIAAAVLSWLVAFNVVNARSPFVHAVGEFLYRVTEPLLRPIRNLLPAMGGIDISPIILILIIIFIQSVIIPNLAKALI
jgi:YggT family protein